mgnify:CR=1 FL=1
MNEENAQVIYDLLDRIKVTDENRERMEKIRKFLSESKFQEALDELQILQMSGNVEYEDYAEVKEKERKIKERKQEEGLGYPVELADTELEKRYIGLLLNDVKQISAYYFLHKDCLFLDEQLLDVYKTVLFTDGEKYAPEIAKEGFNFARTTDELIEFKYQIQVDYENSKFKMEKTYTELKKLFTLRRCCRENPVKHIQKEIADIRNYELYDKMTVEEVEGAVEQVTATEKFKRSVLNDDLTGFLVRGDNTLTNGLSIPFKILSSVFKGIRQGETMAFAMPSNSGKSRFTINLAAYIALIHKKKVLLISNEMSEEKMKLCLITTIINNPEIQELHGQHLHKTEGELLEFKFRPDDPTAVRVDENGYVVKEEDESQAEFARRLSKISTEFNKTVKVTEWLNEQSNNCVYFINITDHTNDELKKVITNYYYKEKIEYMFYDTMKTDTQNIGKSEEIKKTATIISNLAQNLNIFIGYTMQLTETTTLPVNLTINDLSESRTVKEVLDTLCLVKQIDNRALKDYEYSLEEVSDKFYPLKEYKDPDERYYACVVDKNRAGSKPKVVFNLNLAYNRWTELGYLRLKEK